MNQFGRQLRFQIFGESHGPAIGGILDGVPAGMPVDPTSIQQRLDQRRPGTSKLVSARNEPDRIEFLSGVHNDRATGAPLAFLIKNQDARSKDYGELIRKPRPGHSDHVADVWARGHHDPRGGGHYSGRLTACLVAAAAIIDPLLAHAGISVGAHLACVGETTRGDPPESATSLNGSAAQSSVLHAGDDAAIIAAIEAARAAKDSLGGIIEWRADGVPIALGDPLMDSVESLMAHLMFAIPAVKGVDFGSGFAAASMQGSTHNDGYRYEGDDVVPTSNHAGGILGGRTTGAPLWGSVAIKPTSSIFLPQQTVDKETQQDDTLELKGRHDPCIAIRAVPVVRAAAEFVLADLVLLAMQQGHAEVPAWSS